ncbi:MAG TPA: response regulator [Opitutales bacterium]|nr:response regulator [Opitutales bacterium]
MSPPPFSLPERHTETPEAPPGLPAAAVGRVLVVDDDPGSRSMLGDWLGAYGHQVRTAADGPEALLAVEQELPDVIVMDVMMPGMDGFTVCERLKRDPKTAGIPILLLTALNERDDRMRGMRAGANDFLMKPADLPYVLLRVRNAVRLRQLHNEVKLQFAEVCREQQMRESLLHMIVHDLRTPLAGLEGFLQLLQMSAGSKLDDRPAHYLKQALHASHNLAHQIDLLLDIHRMEEGKMPVQAVAHDVRGVVDRALEPLRPLFGNRKLKLEMPQTPTPGVGDPGLLGRVLSNLVGNAIAFTSAQEGEISVRLRNGANMVRVEVEDNGSGIEPEKLEMIFEKFTQVGEQVRSRSSGLGLAFCKLAMEAQHGKIGVVSRVGLGSRFWFEVPAEEQ